MNVLNTPSEETFERLAKAVEDLSPDSKIGNLLELDTIAKANLVAAINEQVLKVDRVTSEVESKIQEHDSNEIAHPHLQQEIADVVAQSNDIETQQINIDKRVSSLEFGKPKRYGVKINKNDSNPETRIEYILDAESFTPARMNYVTGKFNYGSWGDLWFIKDNYPCMLSYNGTEAYKLNPNDYSKKIDGSASDIANTAFAGNAMSSIPLVWVKQYEDLNYEYIILSQSQYDATYKAFAHSRADGSIMDKIYLSMFRGTDDNTRLRSISGLQPMHSKTGIVEKDKAVANGALWNTRTWAHRNLINCLLTVISKHDDSQTAFGNGNLNYQASATPTMGILETGTLNTSGQFMGYSDNTHQVKVFHIEAWWADQWERIQGLINVNGNVATKMIPPYNFTGAGFYNTGITPSGTSNGYISKSTMGEFGRVPSVALGTSATYQCDGLWFNNTVTAVALVGGLCDYSVRCGSSCVSLDGTVAAAYWGFGAALSCEEPLVA